MKYIASLSGGKDSLAMVLKLMELERPLTHCVFYDAGMEYQSIYNNIEKIKPMLAEYGCELVILKPKLEWLMEMLIKPVCEGKSNEHYGYEWCGGCTRWQTRNKVAEINNFLKGFDEYTQYIGIAKDEPKRIKQELNKEYPLVEKRGGAM